MAQLVSVNISDTNITDAQMRRLLEVAVKETKLRELECRHNPAMKINKDIVQKAKANIRKMAFY